MPRVVTTFSRSSDPSLSLVSLHFQILNQISNLGIQIVHLQTLSHFVQEAKGRGDDDLCPAPISQDSLDGNAHQVFLSPPRRETLTFPTLNKSISIMAHLFYKLLLTYHMLSVRHDAGL